MRHKPHNYQRIFIDHASAFMRTADRGAHRMYAAPTGSGKGVVLAELIAEFKTWHLITPRFEVVTGLLDKLGFDVGDDLSPTEIQRLAELNRIFTPIRYRNLLMNAMIPVPDGILIDESHHDNADTYKEIETLTAGRPKCGVTATPYRGTPAGTQELLARWGEPVWVISYEQAANQFKCIQMPDCRVLPLVDDDTIEIANGEFKVTSTARLVMSRAEALAEICRDRLTLNMPTMFAFPSTESLLNVRDSFERFGLPVDIVTQETTRRERRDVFRRVLNCETYLFQINVISEGVDLHIKRLIDCRPTMSPVVFMQQFGRIMRPGGVKPEYFSACRNLERHCYLLAGILPADIVREAQQAFDKPSKRTGARAVGLEALGRFRPTAVEFIDGTVGVMYCVRSFEGADCVEWAVIVHPSKPEPIIAARHNEADGAGRLAYSRWQPATLPPSLEGFQSVKPWTLSPKQETEWNRRASYHGLDPDAQVNGRSIQALFVMKNLNVTFNDW